MRSQLTAQFMQFFRLIAHILTFRDKKYTILTFCNKKYHILTFCDKTELYLTVLQQNNVEACLRCEASLSLAPSCSLLLSQAPYCSPNLRTTSSLGSQGPCSARSGAATLSASLAATTILNSDTMNENFSNLQGPRRLAMGTQYCSYACILGYVFTPGALQHVPRATAPT